MKRIFGAKKEKPPAPTIEQASDRLTARGDALDEKIRKLDEQLIKHREAIRKTRPGPAQEAAKRRALQVLKQKKMYEGQRDQLYDKQGNLDNAAFMMQNAQDQVLIVQAMESSNNEMKKLMKQNQQLKIENIDKMADDAYDIQYWNEEINDAMAQMYSVPNDVDEDELLAELDGLEDDVGLLEGPNEMPVYLQEPELPSAPQGEAAQQEGELPEDEFGLPAVPQRI